MGKAFTEEEKVKIKEAIMETALKFFHDQSTKSLSIAELTKTVGIAQGSFYNFWQDKETLIMDLMAYRSIQKLNDIEKNFSHSLTNPQEFLSDIIYHYSIDLIEKIKVKPIYREAFKIFASKDNKKVKKTLWGVLRQISGLLATKSCCQKCGKGGLSECFCRKFYSMC